MNKNNKKLKKFKYKISINKIFNYDKKTYIVLKTINCNINEEYK